ncbi:MAG: hypothetical protein HC815_06075 [Richelia sp. RM1_1_1]|nr:hypothetical protein [Richelia sp. RM1_1_1]
MLRNISPTASLLLAPLDMPAIRDRILFELKLGRQASGYRAAKKALNQLIAELKRRAETLD